ncbi:response regulator containing a CheY-like receiver domain and an HTH DNA-binding domain [Mycolicibacterium chubuense NBB4]|uniref:Response regulator containing a CheY-like receiver domain and an HTH DNA-binding domain n=1 Tax=Mycolicibacterium chubuense (strain NBB4) TaxID=710421 RepID=I4BIL5_MYCCN|nr:response regulator transcription factor [Mycolicibacterium chubuense]AFM17122.1 response regulator containing a CheY-like receiver domain and an HTH DNA-binding domain [Mycolicibacterium chubuense NBB4]
MTAPCAAPRNGGVHTMVRCLWGRHHGTVADRRVRVWVVDDQASFRMAAAATLDAMDGFEIAGQCDSGEAAIEGLRHAAADMVLMDIHMPGMGGIDAARAISAQHPGLVLVLMSTYDFADLPAAAADCGAASYLHKERLCPDVLSRIWRAAG